MGNILAIIGRMVGMQAQMMPVLSSTEDQYAAATLSCVVSEELLIIWTACRRRIATIHTLQPGFSNLYHSSNGATYNPARAKTASRLYFCFRGIFKVLSNGSGRMQSTKSEIMQTAALKNHHISNLMHLPPGMLLFQK